MGNEMTLEGRAKQLLDDPLWFSVEPARDVIRDLLESLCVWRKLHISAGVELRQALNEVARVKSSEKRSNETLDIVYLSGVRDGKAQQRVIDKKMLLGIEDTIKKLSMDAAKRYEEGIAEGKKRLVADMVALQNSKEKSWLGQE